MNDPTTIPLIQDDVYGPTNTVKENRTSMRGAIYRPDTFNIIGASTDNDHVRTDRTNLRGSQHDSCDISDTGLPSNTYNPTSAADEQAGISGNVYTADADVQYASNFRPTWSRIGLNPSFSRLKRTKRVNKHKKNMVYCM